MNKNYIIVLDTETACGFSKPLVYDFGYVIAEKDSFNIIKKRNYLIKNVFDNLQLFNTAYYKDKRPLYESLKNAKQIKSVYFGFAMYQLFKDMENYGISELYAYNSRFDFKSLNATYNKFNNKDFNNNIIDIMDFINVFTDTTEYKNFCFENGFITKHTKPQPQKKAETLQRYLLNDIDFIENHTALSDSEIEYNILFKCLECLK